MREIKFRAWDGEEMRYTFSVQSNGDGVLYSGGIVDWKLMQFTGLKDKNGKEIYEGDILSEKWLVEVYKNEEGTYMVRFHLNHFANKPRSLKKYLLERDIAGTSDIDNFIIGNIYEHPELLNN